MMCFRYTLPLLLTTLFMPGVVAKEPISVPSRFWEDREGSIAIVLMSFPESGRYDGLDSPGLLGTVMTQLAVVNEMEFLDAIDVSTFATIGEIFADELELLGYSVLLYGKRPKRKDLEKRTKTGREQFKFDLTSIFEETGAHRIILIELNRFGLVRGPSDTFLGARRPYGTAYVQGRMIERGDHRLLWDTEWRYGIFKEKVIGDYNEPPYFPKLHVAINRALARSGKFLMESFFGNRLSGSVYRAIDERITAALKTEELEAEAGAAAKRTEDIESYLEDIDDYRMVASGCKKPYRLTQDCNVFNKPSRKITINGAPAKVAGSEAGDIILVWTRHDAAPYADKEALRGLAAVILLLKDSGLEIEKVSAMRLWGKRIAYWVKTNGDGYSLLLPFTD